MRTGQLNSAAGVLLTLLAAASAAREHTDAACPSAAQERPDVVAARAALEAAPALPPRRIKLADLLLEAECFGEAIRVLEEGEALNPRNVVLQNRLIRARSMVREKQYFEGLDDAEASARSSRNKLRCTRLSDIAACDDLLNLQPRNLDILMAKGDALEKSGRIDEAAGVYARAAQAAPDNALIAGKLQALQSQRQQLQKLCTAGQGDAALQACTATLVRGAPNEFDQTKRIAILLQSANQPGKALDAYIAANSLKHGDRSVALAVLALLDSTKRGDAIALAARGESLLTLGRPGEALAALREANALTPGLPDVANQLASAEALVRTEAATRKEIKPRVATSSVTPETAATPLPRTYSNLAQPARSN